MSRNLPNMDINVPETPDDDGVWGAIIDDDLEKIDEHDHSTSKGVKVPAGGLNINGDVSWGDNNITAVNAVAFKLGGTVGANLRRIFVDADGNLAYNNGSGVKVRITSGSSIDANQVGAIKGDYGATDAALYYDDAAKSYRMLQEDPMPNNWAAVECGDLKLWEKTSGPTYGVTIKSPASVAADYTLTLPGAVPGSTSLLQVTSAGVIQAERDIVVDEVTMAGRIRALEAPGDTYHLDVTVPTGWEAAASADQTAYLPEYADFSLGNLASATDLLRFPLQGSGTWTPTINVNTVAHGSYSSQSGVWQQNGNLLFLYWAIVATSMSASAGDLIDIAGIPAALFTSGGGTTFRLALTGPLNYQSGTPVPEHYPSTNVTSSVIRLQVSQGNTVANWPATSVITGSVTTVL